jgi:hypothetical protein
MRCRGPAVGAGRGGSLKWDPDTRPCPIQIGNSGSLDVICGHVGLRPGISIGPESECGHHRNAGVQGAPTMIPLNTGRAWWLCDLTASRQ